MAYATRLVGVPLGEGHSRMPWKRGTPAEADIHCSEGHVWTRSRRGGGGQRLGGGCEWPSCCGGILACDGALRRFRGAPPARGRALLLADGFDEEVKVLRVVDGRDDVLFLQRLALRLLREDPGPQRQLQDEELARFGEEDGRFGGDHADVLVGLHDPLDARQREVIVVLKGLLRRDLELLHQIILLEPKVADERVHLPSVGVAALLVAELRQLHAADPRARSRTFEALGPTEQTEKH
mmetsp:Transcript_1268/g.4573  ORF Transcript_1268/g.4573 Transcript_1268/m.4573 type:complete len:238 (-) Transcript_1268:7-720(-)